MPFTERITMAVGGCALAAGLMACLTGCGPEGIGDFPFGPGASTPAEFVRKTILTGGVAPGTNFTQPAFLRFGPDGRLYVTTYSGSIFALRLSFTHAVIQVDEHRPLGHRLLTGIAFDPASTAAKPILYVVSNAPPLYGAPDLSGRVSRIDDLEIGAVTDLIVGLPRSAENHMTFDLEFGPDGRLYICQGGSTNNGAPSPGLFENRSEHPLSAALLVADVRNPAFAGISDVQVFAPGLRNTYGICLHRNGRLYGLDQGANEGFGGIPLPGGGALPDPGSYLDELHVLRAGFYYGHPNPARSQYAFNQSLPGGAPYSPALTFFPEGSVVTGIAEYDSHANDGALNGKLLMTGFGDDSLRYATLSSDGLAVTDKGVLATDFDNPLDVTVGTDGTIYVLEAGDTLGYGGKGTAKITVLEPVDPADVDVP